MTINRDVAAGALANAWTALVQVAFIPVYVDILGVEAYGLIGLYTAMAVVMTLLDFGMTATVNREVGLSRAGARALSPTRDLLRSAEAFLLGLGSLVFVAVWIVAPWISALWLRPEGLDLAATEMAVRIIGALLGLRLFMGAHRGAIVGAQEFGWFNRANAGFATLRGVGVVPILWAWPTVEAFFMVQLAVTLVETLLTRRKACALLPGPAAISWRTLEGVQRFRGGVALATAASVVITQADKIVASALLPLSQFGYYAVASAAASALGLLAAPVGMVAYPRLTQFVGAGDGTGAVGAFHHSARLVSLAVAPAAVVLAAFAEAILRLWTGDAVIASHAAAPLAILAFAGMLNAGLQLHFVMSLAHGRSRAAAGLSWALAVPYVPALAWAVTSHGAPGAAWAWLCVNAAALAVVTVLPVPGLPWRERWRWLALDVGAPVAASVAAVAVAAWTLNP